MFSLQKFVWPVLVCMTTFSCHLDGVFCWFKVENCNTNIRAMRSYCVIYVISTLFFWVVVSVLDTWTQHLVLALEVQINSYLKLSGKLRYKYMCHESLLCHLCYFYSFFGCCTPVEHLDMTLDVGVGNIDQQLFEIVYKNEDNGKLLEARENHTVLKTDKSLSHGA